MPNEFRPQARQVCDTEREVLFGQRTSGIDAEQVHFLVAGTEP